MNILSSIFCWISSFTRRVKKSGNFKNFSFVLWLIFIVSKHPAQSLKPPTTNVGHNYIIQGNLLAFICLDFFLEPFTLHGGMNPAWVTPHLVENPSIKSNMYCIGSVLILALITIPPGSFGNLAAKRYKSTCDTNPTDIHLTKGT